MEILAEDLDFVFEKCVYRLSLTNCEAWIHRDNNHFSVIHLGKNIMSRGYHLKNADSGPFEEIRKGIR